MKKLIKGLCVTLLSCTCLLAATACGNKSECKQDEAPTAQTDEIETKGDCNDCPDCPTNPDCPDCPDCPEIPDNPNDGQEKDDKDTGHKRPFPHRRGARIRLLPCEFLFGEWDEDGVFYLYFPIRR